MPNTYYKTFWTGFLGEIRPILDIEVTTAINEDCVFGAIAQYEDIPPCEEPRILSINFSGGIGTVVFTAFGQNPCQNLTIEWSRDEISWSSASLGSCSSPGTFDIGEENAYGFLYFRMQKECQIGGLISPYSDLAGYQFSTPNPTPTPTNTPTVTPTNTPTVTPTNTPTITPSPTTPFDSFQMTVKTDNAGSSSSNQFILATFGTNNDFDVDWGDGNLELWQGNTGNITHTYSGAGTYQISISRYLNGLRFSNTGDRTKVISIDKWGDIVWSSMTESFWGCTNMNMVATDTPILSSVSSLDAMFFNCINMTGNTSFNSWNVSSITNLRNTFYGCSKFNQSLSGWNVSNVSTFQGMFKGAVLFNQNINNWDVSKSTNFSEMFEMADSFNQPLSGWNVSSATTLSNMFLGANVFNQNINNWNVSNVTNFSGTFYAVTQFNQPLSGWNVSAATNMNNMFRESTSFNQSIDNWNTSNVTSMGSMFYGSNSFNQSVNSWDVSKVTNFQSMFGEYIGTMQFNQPLNNWVTTAATNMEGMFNGARNFNQDINNWNTSGVTNFKNFMRNAIVYNQDLSGLEINSVPNGHNFDSFLFNNTGLTTENYSRLLISFANQMDSLNKPTGCTINNGNRTYNNTNYGGSPYSDGAAARAALVSSGWTITDGGQI